MKATVVSIVMVGVLWRVRGRLSGVLLPESGVCRLPAIISVSADLFCDSGGLVYPLTVTRVFHRIKFGKAVDEPCLAGV